MQRERLVTGIRIWGVRRIQAATIARAWLGTLLVVLSFMWHWFAGAVTIGAVGIAFAVSRLSRPSEDQRPRGLRGWSFGGQVFAFARLGVIDPARQRQVIDALHEYHNGETIELLVWVTARDEAGNRWALVQEDFASTPPRVTASVASRVPRASDPFIEAEQLAAAAIGIEVDEVSLIGWGIDWSQSRAVDVLVAVAQTRAPAGSFTPGGSDRSWRLVELHPDPIAGILTRFDAARWQAAAVWSLAALLDGVHPGTQLLLEELVYEPWKSKQMFSRLGRLTATIADPESQSSDPVVLEVDNGSVIQRRQARPRPHPRPNRALSWEIPDRRTPTRYG